MPYRQASKPSSPPRKRPPPTLVLQRWLTWSLLAIAAVSFALAVFFLPLALGAKVDCVRAMAGAVPACTLRNVIALDPPAGFDGEGGALFVLVRHDLNEKGETTETMLKANEFTTRIVSEPAASAAVSDYIAFASDPRALSFHRHVPGPSGHLFLVAFGALIAVACALGGSLRERSLRLVIDDEVDELVLESVAIVRRARVRAYPLSRISAVHVVPVHPTPENTDYELSIVSNEGHQRLLRADASGCQRAAIVIRTSAGLG